VASTITRRSGSRVGVVNVAMQCAIGFIYGEDGYASIYEYEGTNKNYMKVWSTKVDDNKAQVYALVLSLVKDVLVCTTSNNTFTYLSYQQLYFLSTNLIPKEMVIEVIVVVPLDYFCDLL
jgi:hypothetical protein